VAHTYNPSYSGGRDQEDHGLKPAQANTSQDPILKKIYPKKRADVGQSIGPEFKPQYHKKKKKAVSFWCKTGRWSPAPLVLS
jgi:hypothetical protein